MIEHIPALAAAGVDSLKIEGRMKSAYYVAMVTKVYRAALDRFSGCAEDYEVDPAWLDELKNLSHRPYTTGFYLPGEDTEKEYPASSAYLGGHDFVATVEGYDPNENSLRLKARNRFAVNDQLEIIGPGRDEIVKLRVKRITDMRTGEDLPAAHNSYLVRVYPAESNLGVINRHSFVRKTTT
jgi:U32 family peptidase